MVNGVKHSNGHKFEGILPSTEPELSGPAIAAGSVTFDLDTVLTAVRPLRSSVPADCHSARTLGTEREGNAILIDGNGLFLTIGYLVVEATEVLIGAPNGAVLNAHPIGYDHETGFGLVRSLEQTDFSPIELAPNSQKLTRDSRVIVASAGGPSQALDAHIADRRLFAGSWEYMLDSAIFTAPLHPNWSGAALIDPGTGELCGVGSLFVQGPAGDEDEEQGNMFVPIELLTPILRDLLKTGRRSGPRRPWMGLHAAEALGSLVVVSVFDGGPAFKAGIQPGDILEQIEEKPVDTLESFYRELWSAGEAGASIKLGVIRGSTGMNIFVGSCDRQDFYKQPQRH